MEAPEKIYVSECMIFATNPEITLPKNDKIEYIHTDAFIEKVWDWIEDNILSSNQRDKSLLYYKQLKNYIKGK